MKIQNQSQLVRRSRCRIAAFSLVVSLASSTYAQEAPNASILTLSQMQAVETAHKRCKTAVNCFDAGTYIVTVTDIIEGVAQLGSSRMTRLPRRCWETVTALCRFTAQGAFIPSSSVKTITSSIRGVPSKIGRTRPPRLFSQATKALRPGARRTAGTPPETGGSCKA
jgi:hypothetical protein